MLTQKVLGVTDPDFKIEKRIKEEIILRIVDLLHNSDLVSSNYGDRTYSKIKIYCQDRYIKFEKEAHKNLTGFIFKQLNLKHNFTEKYVTNFIKEIISLSFEKGINFVLEEPLIIDIFNHYFYQVIVYIPLDGIKMDKDLLTVGKINFKKVNQNYLEFLENKFMISVLNNPNINRDEQFRYIERALEFFPNLLGPCAEYKVFSTYKKAIILAEQECAKSFDLIRYAIGLLYHEDYRIFIGMQGDVTRNSRSTVVIKSDYRNYHFRDEIIGALYKFEINDENISKMRRIGFFKLSEILKQSDETLTNLERSLLIAIHWYAGARIQKELENEFLSLMICLEIFLTPNDRDESISLFIASAVAIIIADYEHRTSLRNRIKNFYKIRSEIVHEGKIDLNEKETRELRHIVEHLIIWMLNHGDQINSTTHLINLLKKEFKDQKLYVDLDLNDIES